MMVTILPESYSLSSYLVLAITGGNVVAFVVGLLGPRVGLSGPQRFVELGPQLTLPTLY